MHRNIQFYLSIFPRATDSVGMLFQENVCVLRGGGGRAVNKCSNFSICNSSFLFIHYVTGKPMSWILDFRYIAHYLFCLP